MALDLDSRPILVFWETTKACSLACRHCRAEAIAQPAPGELNHAEALRLLDSLAAFGDPRPVLVATGGDVLERRRLDVLIEHAVAQRIPLALAPSVTPRLTDARVEELRRLGVRIVSISLDGLLEHAVAQRIPLALAPSVTPRLTDARVEEL